MKIKLDKMLKCPDCGRELGNKVFPEARIIRMPDVWFEEFNNCPICGKKLEKFAGKLMISIHCNKCRIYFLAR